jgi:hypothetical protein
VEVTLTLVLWVPLEGSQGHVVWSLALRWRLIDFSIGSSGLGHWISPARRARISGQIGIKTGVHFVFLGGKEQLGLCILLRDHGLANHSSQNLHKLYLKIETRFEYYSGRCDLPSESRALSIESMSGISCAGDVRIYNEYESSEKAIPWIVFRWTAMGHLETGGSGETWTQIESLG